jgi:hypothetical protein
LAAAPARAATTVGSGYWHTSGRQILDSANHGRRRDPRRPHVRRTVRQGPDQHG